MAKRFRILAILLVASTLLSISAFAKGPAQSSVAAVSIKVESILLQPSRDFKSYTVVVSGPSGIFTYEYAGGEHGLIEIITPEGDVFEDGTYTYQITATPYRTLDMSDRNTLVLTEDTSHNIQNGTFAVRDGELVDPTLTEDSLRSALIENLEDQDDPHAQVFTTDLIVQGSSCVGVDCTSSESFSFDTIRMKENNLRIHFQDTSSSAGFPSNDWRLTANDSSNGGQNRFSIEDATAVKTPMTIIAGAPNNSIYVSEEGRVGFGNATPVVNLHVTEGNSPTLRLEQDGSASFTPQVWDISGNEANFFIRDVTNGSSLPLRIKPGSDNDDTLVLNADGNIGVGRLTASELLDIGNGVSPENVRIRKGNLTADEGDIALTKGDVTLADGSVELTKGSVALTSGNVLLTRGDTILNDGDIILNEGDIILNEGNITSSKGTFEISDNIQRAANINTVADPATMKLVYNGTDTDTHQLLRLFSEGQVNQSFTDTANNITWRLAMFGGTGNNDDNFQITRAGVSVIPFKIDQNGDATFAGTVTANGTLLTSDVNAKENFEMVDGKDILSKVASLPLTSWNYKTQEESVRHYGPMAQDFYAAFGFGHNDVSIDAIDSMGVALGAIQGLNELVEEKNAEIAQLKKMLVDQEARMDARLKALESKLD